MSMVDSRLRRAWDAGSEKARKKFIRFMAFKWYAMMGHEGRIFLTTIPKSGTHLIERCLRMLPGVHESGLFLRRFEGGTDVPEAEPLLERLGRGCFVRAHLPFSEERRDILARLGYRCVLMIRDPRDLVVSQYVFRSRPLNLRDSTQRAHYRSLSSDGERLMAAIRGIDGLEESLMTKYATYLRWAEHGSFVARFETMVGPMGGGSREAQVEQISALSRHLGIELPPGRAEDIADQMWSRRAGTFRKGVIGDWVNHFTPEHKKVFKEETGDLLVRLGYEKNMDW